MDIRLSKIRVVLPTSRRTLFSIDELKIPFGTRLLIEGPSGQGKTSLLHLIAGLFPPTEGSVYLGEARVGTLSEIEVSRVRRKHFGIIFQRLNLLDHLTALENVLLVSSLEAAQKALEWVGLSASADQICNSMSLGEQQRIAVARVIAARPDIILADEPTSSLDAKNAGLILDGLFKASEGKTLVVVSHDERIRSRFSAQLDFGKWVTP